MAGQHNTTIYMEQGGDKQVTESGGTLEVQSGGILDLQAGATLTNAATQAESGVVTQTGQRTVSGVGDTIHATGTFLKLESGAKVTVESGAAIDEQAGGKVGSICGATMVVGTETGPNTINVTIQLTDALGADIAVVGNVQAFLSDASTGIGITASVPDGGVTIGTDGAIIATHLTSGAWQLQSEADGDIDLNIVETGGTPTFHLVVVLPNGLQIVSSAITYA